LRFKAAKFAINALAEKIVYYVKCLAIADHGNYAHSCIALVIVRQHEVIKITHASAVVSK
jgi:hypothetical protein